MTPIEFISTKEYLTHLLNLDNDSRRWRFGYPAADYSIEKYVESIKSSDIIVGIREPVPGNSIVSAMHLSVEDDHTSAEMGISTVSNFRRMGHAERLLKHSIDVLRNRGIYQLYTTCLSDNVPLISLFKKLGITSISHEPGGKEARISLPMPAPDSIIGEINNTRMVIIDKTLRPLTTTWHNIVNSLTNND